MSQTQAQVLDLKAVAGSREGQWTDPRGTGVQAHGGTQSTATEPSCPAPPRPFPRQFCRA